MKQRIGMTRRALAAAILISIPLAGQAQSPSAPPQSGNSAAISAQLEELAKAARQEGALTVYASTPQTILQKIVNDFSKAYPGIKVTVFQSVANGITETFLADFKRNQVKADVVQTASNQQVDDIAATGALDDYIPVGAERLRKDTRTAEPKATNYLLNAVTWGWRSNLPEPLKKKLSQGDWSAFEDPEVIRALTGRVAAADPAIVGSMFSALQGLKFADEAKYKKMLTSFAALKPVFYESNVPVIDALKSGEVLAVYAHHGFLVDAIGAGAPIETAFYNPTPAGSSFLSLPKNAPHPAAGKLFISWIISDDGQNSLARNYAAESALIGHKDVRAQTKMPWYTPQSHDPSRITVISPATIKANSRQSLLSEFNAAVRP